MFATHQRNQGRSPYFLEKFTITQQFWRSSFCSVHLSTNEQYSPKVIHILHFIGFKTKVFPFLSSLSYMMGLELWDCFGTGKTHLMAEFYTTDFAFWGVILEENLLCSWIKMLFGIELPILSSYSQYFVSHMLLHNSWSGWTLLSESFLQLLCR